ncbi:hypothetical protein MRX96_050593 [Rhipicephalus microplus]
MRHRRQGCMAPSNAFRRKEQESRVRDVDGTSPYKKASQDALASGHGKNAGSRSLTVHLAFLVQALFLTSASFFDAPTFKPSPAVTTCDIDGKAALLLPTLF